MASESVQIDYGVTLRGDRQVERGVERIETKLLTSKNALSGVGGAASGLSRIFEMGLGMAVPISLAGVLAEKMIEAGDQINELGIKEGKLAAVNIMGNTPAQIESSISALQDFNDKLEETARQWTLTAVIMNWSGTTDALKTANEEAIKVQGHQMLRNMATEQQIKESKIGREIQLSQDIGNIDKYMPISTEDKRHVRHSTFEERPYYQLDVAQTKEHAAENEYSIAGARADKDYKRYTDYSKSLTPEQTGAVQIKEMGNLLRVALAEREQAKQAQLALVNAHEETQSAAMAANVKRNALQDRKATIIEDIQEKAEKLPVQHVLTSAIGAAGGGGARYGPQRDASLAALEKGNMELQKINQTLEKYLAKGASVTAQ